MTYHRYYRRRSRPCIQLEQLEARQLLAINTPVITEFMAVNDTTLVDGAGRYSDWIEIKNPTAGTIDLDGYYLTDNYDDRQKWRFPSVPIEPGERVLVFASGQNEALIGDNAYVDADNYLHTNFKLTRNGEYLALISPDGETVVQDFGIEYPPQSQDVSFGVEINVDHLQLVGRRAPISFHIPSANDATLESGWTANDFDDSVWSKMTDVPSATVLISEIGNGDSSDFGDLVEYHNVSGKILDTEGWIMLFNNRGTDINNVHGVTSAGPILQFPSTLEADEVVLFEDKYGSANNIFWRRTGNGWAMILDDERAVIDFVLWGFTVNELQTLDFTIDKVKITGAELDQFWNGLSVDTNPFGNNSSLKRTGSADHNDASDFAFTAGRSIGLANRNLTVPFSGQQLVSARTGLGFDVPEQTNGGNTSLQRLIEANVSDEMHNVNSSVWLRLPFELSDLSLADEMFLSMTYDDGFVAFLNGMEIARGGAPDNLTWNSAATLERAGDENLTTSHFDVSAYAGQLRIGTNVLAIQGLNISAADTDLLVLPELFIRETPPAAIPDSRFFGLPTPGTPNNPALQGVAGTVTIDTPRRIFREPFSVSLATTSPDVEIRYTLDADEPTAESPLWDGTPILVDETTGLWARAFRDNFSPGPIAKELYTKLDEDVIEFSSNLPVIILDNGGGARPSAGTVRDFQFALFTPNDVTERTVITVAPDVLSPLGLRIRGQSSAGFPKNQYRIELRDGNGNDEPMSLLGLPANSDWVLNGPYTDKSLIRNAFVYELGRELGLSAPRTRHVEVYLNRNGSPLEARDYMGVYILVEAIKIDEGRVDITPLETVNIAEPDITGGYLMRFEHSVSERKARISRLSHLELVNAEDYTPLQQQWISDHIDLVDSVIKGPNFEDPIAGYEKYIDVDSFVNNIVINELSREQDSYVRSAYSYQDRNGKLVRGPLWDYNLTFDVGCCFDNRNPTGWQLDQSYSSSLHGWQNRLLEDSDFSQRVIDRWQNQRRGGLLDEANLFARVHSLANPLVESQERNFERWNILGRSDVGFPTPRSETWQQQIDIMKDWMQQRLTWIDQQFVSPPIVTQSAAEDVNDVQLSIRAEGGHIYYTTDGSDPRGPGGITTEGARLYSGEPFIIPRDTKVMVRAWDQFMVPDNSDFFHTQWSAPTLLVAAETKPVAAGDLVVTELNYNPADARVDAGEPDVNNDDFEFVELTNVSDEPLNLAGVRLAEVDSGNGPEGIEFTFDAGQLSPTQSVIVISNHAAFMARYGDTATIAQGNDAIVGADGEFAGRLANGGEQITLLDAVGQTIQQFTYDDGWYPGTDGKGSTLQVVDPFEPDLNQWNNQQAWRSSGQSEGSPGRMEGATQGDFNHDQSVNAQDIDLLYAEIRQGTGNLQFDLTGDGKLNQTDVDEMVFGILGTGYGDANLDGRVDSRDFAALVEHFGNTTALSWSQGDFDGDLDVDFRDFNLLSNAFEIVGAGDSDR